jgi:hypothetical protein
MALRHRWQGPLQLPNNLNAKVNERPHLGWRVLARGVEGVEREDWAVPFREEIDQCPGLELFFNAPAYELTYSGSCDTFIHHRLGIGKDQWAPGWDFNRLRIPYEFPFVGLAAIRINELQTTMLL